MRRAAGGARWALSFADLCLLLLGFFVLLQARPDPHRLTQSMRTAFGDHGASTLERPARLWFEPGEAVLRPQARAALAAFAHDARSVSIASRGTEAGTARFDAWELAAARAAAVARALTDAGVAPGAVNVAIEPMTGGGQTLFLSRQ